MGRIPPEARRRALAIALVFLVVVGLAEGPFPGGSLPVHLGVLTAIGMSFGPLAVLPAGVVALLAGLVTASDQGALVLSVTLAAVVALPTSAALDRINSRHGPFRTTAALADFVVVTIVGAVVHGVLFSATGGDAAPAEIVDSSLALHTVVPGLRVAMIGVRLRPGMDRRRATLLLLGMALATAVAAALLREDLLLVVLVQLAIVLWLATRWGYALAALITTGTTFASVVLRSGLGIAPLEPPLDQLFIVNVIVLGVYLTAVESDRSRDLLAERDVTFTAAANPALVVAGVTPWSVLRANDRAMALFDGPVGRPLAEVLGEGVAELAAHAVDDDAGVRAIARLPGEETMLADVAVTPLRLRGPVRDRLYIEVVDVTELAETGAALGRANEELSGVARTIAHDLAQPLASLAGFAETIRTHDQDLDVELRAELLDRLASSANGVRDRVADIVASAAAAGRAPTDVQLRPVLDAAVDSLASVEHELDVELDLAVEQVVVERAVLVRVLGNLLDNAVKHGGADRDGVVHVRSRRRRGGVVVQVVDDGQGIPVADLGRIMETGTRLRPGTVVGSGLGLASARRRAHIAGCELEAFPEPVGARFELWIPDGTGAVPLRVLSGVVDDRHRATLRTLLDHDARVRDVGAVTNATDLVLALGVVRPDVVLVDEHVLRDVPDGDRARLARPPRRTVVVADGATLTGLSDLAQELGVGAALTPEAFDEGLARLLDPTE